MKKLITLCVVVLFAFGAKAQLNNWYVGGMVGFRQFNDEMGTGNPNNPINTESTAAWWLAPEVGVGIGERFSVGLVLGLSGENVSDDNGDVSSTFTFMPDIYGRRWFPVGEKLNLFVGVDVPFGFGSQTDYNDPDDPNDDTESDVSSFGVNLNSGLGYSLAERWTLLFKFALAGYEQETRGDLTDSSVGLLADGNVTNNPFIFVGLYWTFLPANK